MQTPAISYSYVNSTVAILNGYAGKEPFSTYLSNYFSKNKKYGSRDRRALRELCYAYFRLNKALPDISQEEKIKFSAFGTGSNLLANIVDIELEDNSLESRIGFLERNENLSLNSIFPSVESLSESIDSKAFFIVITTAAKCFCKVKK